MKNILISLAMLSTCHLFIQPLLSRSSSLNEFRAECSCVGELFLYSQFFEICSHKAQDCAGKKKENDRVFSIIRDTYNSAPHVWLAKAELHARRARKFRRSARRPEHEEVSSKKGQLSEDRPAPAEEGKIKFS